GSGNGVVSLNAWAIRSGGVYVPNDHVTSSDVRSRDSMYGGATKSSASAVSPVRASHGNSPSTKNVVAVAGLECLNRGSLYATRPANVSRGTLLSTVTSFQWPSYSVRYRKPCSAFHNRYSRHE